MKVGVFKERQEVKKKRRWIKRLRQVERILLSLAIILAGLASMYGLYRIVFFGDVFKVKKIVVEGNWKYLSARGLAAQTDVEEDDNLFLISVDDVHERLKRNPWVRTATARRRLPDALWIYAEERHPAAIISNGGLFYLDEYGEVFKVPEADDDRNFPVLTGVNVAEDLALSDGDRDRALNMLRILAVYGSSKFGKDNGVAEVHYDENYGYSIITKNDPMQIFLGHAAFDEGISQIERMSHAISNRPGRILYIMANEPGRLIAKYQAS